MSDVSRLSERLQELHTKLVSFDTEMAEDFTSLESAWRRLDSAWDGMAYQEFTESWDQARSMFRQYIGLASKYESFLKERIEALQRFERSGGL